MAKIANRVGFIFPDQKRDTSEEDLAYVYNKLYLDIEHMNTPAPNDSDESTGKQPQCKFCNQWEFLNNFWIETWCVRYMNLWF